MTNPNILEGDPKLAELVRRLVDHHQPERLYLFGSRGRGQGEPDSDYDLLMVLERLEVPAYRIAQDAHGLVWGLGISADILVWSRAEFDRRLPLKASLPATVVREGTLLHAA
jgi:predicted nucleotidyltransferase